MTDNFLRSYTLEWWDDSEEEVLFNPHGLGPQLTSFFESFGYDFKSNPQLYYDKVTPKVGWFSIKPTDVYSTSDLQITGSIPLVKSSTSASSEVITISIFGLSDDLIRTLKNRTKVELSAGYKNSFEGSIFKGEITEVKAEVEGFINKVTITCSSNNLIKKNLFISKSWPKGTSYEQVLVDMLNYFKNNNVTVKNGITPRSGTPSLSEVKLQGGLTVQGNAFKVLDQLCNSKAINYRAYTVNGALYVEPANYPELRNLFRLNPDNIVGKITPTSDQKEDVNGIKVKVLLDSRIDPASIVKITDTSDFDGEWSVTKVTHKLDFEGEDWFTVMEATRITGDSYDIDEDETTRRARLSKET